MDGRRFALACVLFAVSHLAVAQEDSRPWEEYGKLVNQRAQVSALGPDLFGDSVNLINGALSFSTTDVAVPGNNALPVALTRTYQAENRKGRINDGHLADWDLDLPSISGTFGPNWFANRCSAENINLGRPPFINLGGTIYNAEDFWSGNHANIPGGGEMLVADRGFVRPSSGGPYYWVTEGMTYFSCLPSIRNGSGEGFVARTADGTTYRFDWMGRFKEASLKGVDANDIQLPRYRYVLYATRVEDRFGNWVEYDYLNAADAPGRLAAIRSSDERQISIQYDPAGHVGSVGDGLHTWTYEYSPDQSSLTGVVLPDGSRWSIAFSQLTAARIRYERGQPGAGDPVRSCGNPGIVLPDDPRTGSITHPSGAVGEFTIQAGRHGRSNVPKVCGNYQTPVNDPNDDISYYPLAYDAMSLTNKRVSGPGLATMQWAYVYGSLISFAAGTGPVCTTGDCGRVRCTSDSCAGSATTLVREPGDKWTRYTYGNSYRYNEGLLLKVEVGSGSPTSAPLRTDSQGYVLPIPGAQFNTPIGSSPQPRGDGFTAEFLRPLRTATVSLDGASFNRRIDAFDGFGRALTISKWSSLGYGKAEKTEYQDDATRWVLGLVTRMRDGDTDEVISQVDYQPSLLLPERRYRFGKLIESRTYNSDGTVATSKDGNDKVTTLGNWRRGIPQSILHPDNRTQSAVVNPVGWITSTTDENNYTTTYTHDAVGRLASITYPGAGWNVKQFAFQFEPNEEQGLAGGHWRHVTTEGNYRKTILLDALRRPVVEQEEDLQDSGGTKRWLTRRYDDLGRLAFESYPRNPAVDGVVGAGANVLGTHRRYDVLGRPTFVEQDSELGRLVTETQYRAGFTQVVKNPRGIETTLTFEAYDSPDGAQPAQAQGAEGVATSIIRNVYGQPTVIGRWGQ